MLCFNSLTSCTLKICTSFIIKIKHVEIVPPNLSLLSFTPDISFINFFLDTPSNKGYPREWKIETFLNKVILCFKFFPKPIPGSKMILL